MNKRQLLLNTGILLGIYFFLKVGWLLFPRVFETLELQTQDWMIQFVHIIGVSQKISPDIIYVDIDDNSLQSIDYSINDLELYSDLVATLHKAGTKIQLIDMVFVANDSPEPLQEIFKKAGTVFLPLIFSDTDTKKNKLEEWVKPEQFPPASDAVYFLKGTPMVSTSKLLIDSVAGLGHINCRPDIDGVFRRVPLFIESDNRLVPTISLQAAMHYLGVTPDKIQIDTNTITLTEAKFPDGRKKDIAIPFDSRGKSRINFTGPWPYTFGHYSAATILEMGKNNIQTLRDELEGTIVILSDVTTGGRDFGPTPFSSYAPLSGLHGQFFNSILTNTFLYEATPFATIATEITLLILLIIFSVLLRGYLLIGGAVVTSMTILISGFLLLVFAHFVIPVVLPLAILFFGIIAILFTQYTHVQQEKRIMQARLSPYFAPSVMNKILESPELISNVAKKKLTILFSDIVSFSDWSALKEAQEIHETLNRYFREMSGIVFAHEGTIDKFMGDGLLAFFGDPTPYEDHAQRAVLTALAMQKKVWELKQEWGMTGGMKIRIRVGIHTGETVVGNMGSRERMDYTVIGSSVNLAQRLESNCAPDRVLVSKQVHDQLGKTFVTSSGGTIKVKGFPDPVEVYYVDRYQPEQHTLI